MAKRIKRWNGSTWLTIYDYDDFVLKAGSTMVGALVGTDITASGVVKADIVAVHDTDDSNYLRFLGGSNLTADRDFIIVTGDANRQISVLGTSAIDQDVQTTASPTHVGMTLSGANTFVHGGQAHRPHHVGTTAPANPDIGWTWLDISNNRARLKSYNNYGPAYFAMTGSTYFTTPDAAALDITGDIEFICRVRLADATPTNTIDQTFTAKGISTAWEFMMLATGKLRIRIFDTIGAAAINMTSVSATTFTDATTYWFKGNLDVVNGANRVANFYYAPDSEFIPTTWTPLDTVTTAGNVAIASTSDNVAVGARSNAGQPIQTGSRIYRVIVKSGIDGTTVMDWAAYDVPQSFTTTWSSIQTGETWTAVGSPALTRHVLWKIIGGDMPKCMLRFDAASFTVNNNTATAVAWNLEDEDTDGFHTGSADGATVPSGLGGWYDCDYLFQDTNTTAFPRQSWLDVNIASGSAPTSTGRRYAGDGNNGAAIAGSGLGYSGASRIRLRVADVLRLKLFHNQGANQTGFGAANNRPDLNGLSLTLVEHLPE